MEIRSKSISYASYLKKQRTIKKKELLEELLEYEKHIDDKNGKKGNYKI